MIAAVDLMVSRIGPKWSTSSGNVAIRPIRDIIKLTIAAIGIEKKTSYFLTRDGPVDPSCKTSEYLVFKYKSISLGLLKHFFFKIFL